MNTQFAKFLQIGIIAENAEETIKRILKKTTALAHGVSKPAGFQRVS